jgi:hypothetical protein
MYKTIFTSLFLGVIFFGCSSTFPNREIGGEVFPAVEGSTLNGTEVAIPSAFKGKKVILVIGYDMKTQFDIDRWGIGFFTAKLDLPPVYELPTIPGLIPSLLKGRIDGGMRKGIPQESWQDVITIYGDDGEELAKWTGTENPRNARIILVDEAGTVVWFHDRGYGLPPLQELLSVLEGNE